MAPNQEVATVYAAESVAMDDSALKPAKRGGATLTQVGEGGLIYLIGGANREGASFGDVHCFDFETRAWKFVIPSSGSLSPRSGHSAVAIGSKIYVFGGFDVAAGATFNDVNVFDTRTLSWYEAAVEGEEPRPRNAHAAIILPEDDDSRETRRMLVHGGSSLEVGRICGDCCHYSDEEESWIHATLAECKTGNQTEPAMPEVPERFGHCGTTITVQPSNQPNAKATRQGLLIFGGMNAQSDLDDLVLIMTSC
uniref:Uncharacterized protein n=1 Tax=Phytophthora fragariae TaxID=53985 RepID=A0A6A3EBF6_9STRA|nr:hypothetical protein PF009_g20687 [Phytophthora fragariae]